MTLPLPFVVATQNPDKAQEIVEIFVVQAAHPLAAYSIDGVAFLLDTPDRIAASVDALPALTEVPDGLLRITLLGFAVPDARALVPPSKSPDPVTVHPVTLRGKWMVNVLLDLLAVVPGSVAWVTAPASLVVAPKTFLAESALFAESAFLALATERPGARLVMMLLTFFLLSTPPATAVPASATISASMATTSAGEM